MANTTFSGAVRSESTFKTVSKNASTGAFTEVATLGDGPVSLADGNVTLTNATHSGRILLVPDGGQDNTYTLPAPIAGSGKTGDVKFTTVGHTSADTYTVILYLRKNF